MPSQITHRTYRFKLTSVSPPEPEPGEADGDREQHSEPFSPGEDSGDPPAPAE
jgi:hypothetical protein